ncbi:hypothetical protein JCM5350_005335 [Sporobolomyces pararoseus]
MPFTSSLPDWRIRDTLDHLPGALHVVQEHHPSVNRCDLTLTGACALWFHAFSPPSNARHHPIQRGPIMEVEMEVLRIVGLLTFPRYNLPLFFHVRHQESLGSEEFVLEDEAGNDLAPLEIVLSNTQVPCQWFDHSPIKVANGIWIIFDLLLHFLESNHPFATSAWPSKLSPKSLHRIQRAVSTLTLLLYSMERLAQHRLSLNLFGFNHLSEEDSTYRSIHDHGSFFKYSKAVYWFANSKKELVESFSELGARFYCEKDYTPHGVTATGITQAVLRNRIRQSLQHLQLSLRKLTRIIPRPGDPVWAFDWSLPSRIHNLADLLRHPDFSQLQQSPRYYSGREQMNRGNNNHDELNEIESTVPLPSYASLFQGRRRQDTSDSTRSRDSRRNESETFVARRRN